MGVFSNLTVKCPLPEGHIDPRSWQTKAFGDADDYEIDADLQLWHVWRNGARDTHSATGAIRFYDRDTPVGNVPSWIEYCAIIWRGKVLEIFSPRSVTPHYVGYTELLVSVQDEISMGHGDDESTERFRAEMAAEWGGLTEAEIERVRGISARINELRGAA